MKASNIPMQIISAQFGSYHLAAAETYTAANDNIGAVVVLEIGTILSVLTDTEGNDLLAEFNITGKALSPTYDFMAVYGTGRNIKTVTVQAGSVALVFSS